MAEGWQGRPHGAMGEAPDDCEVRKRFRDLTNSVDDNTEDKRLWEELRSLIPYGIAV